MKRTSLILRAGLLCLPLCLVACSRSKTPPLVTLQATPSLLVRGRTADLKWTATNATDCTLSPGAGKVALAGTAQMTPTATTTYALVCRNSGGSARAETTVTVGDQVSITAFAAEPTAIDPGQQSTLRWSAANALSCTLSPGVGTVQPRDGVAVSPSATTLYTLACEGAGGPVSATTSVVVNEPPTAPSLSVVPGDGELTFNVTAPSGAQTTVYFAAESGVTAANVSQKKRGQIFEQVPSSFTVSGLTNGTTYYAVAVSTAGDLSGPSSAEVSGAPRDGVPAPDPLFVDEWHLLNTGQKGGVAGEDANVLPVWDAGLRGEGVRVAIVDEGVQIEHPDLQQNVATGLSYDYSNPQIPLQYDGHATSVAGVVAGRDWNGIGVRGTAPRANFVSYSLLQDPTSTKEADSMTRGSADNAISSNSWGDVDDGTGQLNAPQPLWAAAVDQGVKTGRGGLGTIYVWAAGNGNGEQYLDNANYDGQANFRSVLAIAALNDDGTECSYSEEGANVLVAAPAGDRNNHLTTTTDRLGAEGYNPTDPIDPNDYTDTDYTDTMDGTSSATPVAAGVAALMLQANPNLSWRDVRIVFAKSARKNSPQDSDWTTNGAGLHINHKFGFGAVDAAAAVAMAKSWTPVGPEVVAATAVQSVGAAIPDSGGAPVTSTVSVSGTGVGKVEFVELTLNVTHARTGDLSIVLTNETTGTSDVIAVPHQCMPDPVTHQEACSPISPFTFGSVRHLDEAADGTWSLKIQDERSGVTGTFDNWKLTFHGRAQ